MRKLLLIITTTLFSIIFIAAIGGYFWLQSSLPAFEGQATVPGVDARISVIRDSNGIAHIFAQNRNDALTGLGFAQAQDRLFQLETLRHVAQGRLSELVGSGGLELDKKVRTLGVHRVGAISGSRMSPQALNAVESYVRGINAFIDNHRGSWPLEFTVLGVKPQRWEIADALTLSGLMVLGVDNWEDELTYALLAKRLTKQQLAELFPAYPADGPLSHPGISNTLPRTDKPALARQGWPFSRSFSSSTWVIGGERTVSGKPILASDPHGGYEAPTDYYLVRMVGPDFELVGAAFPGIPAIMLGHNGKIAWGLTDVMSDQADLFIEKTGSNNSYQTPTGTETFTTREEIIKVAGDDNEDVVLKVRVGRHGPIISDAWEDGAKYASSLGDNQVLAVSADALENGFLVAEALINMNRAQNWQQFSEALNDYEFQQNFSFADRDGDIGLVSALKLPHRVASSDGLTPVAGWDGGADWLGVLPVSAMPRTVNPDQGYLFNTNNKTGPADFPYIISHSYAPVYRAERINALLADTKAIDLKGVSTQQLDTLSTAAQSLLPFLLATPSTNETEAKALRLLKSWDGDMDRERAAPLIYTAWLMHFSKLLYADELGELYQDIAESRESFLHIALTSANQWCDDIGTAKTESCDLLLSRSLTAAIADLNQRFGPDPQTWRWGSAHKARFKHLIFSGIPVLSSLLTPEIEVGGNWRTLNNARASYSSETPYLADFGTRYRQIIDLDQPQNSLFIVAPGLSGNVASPFYQHFLERWRDGQYITVSGTKAELLQRNLGEFVLSP